MCLGVLTVLVTTGAAGFVGGDTGPRKREEAGRAPTVHRGDSFEVTVHTVSDVDLFEGVELATGLSFDARVAGLRRVADCWLAESRTTAQNLLRGKTVRLTVKNDVDPGADLIAVDVQLPNGVDYARTIVQDGVARADPAARDELAPVESAARQERRGLWAADCILDSSTATPSSTPSSSTPAPTTTTTTTTTAPEPSAPPRPTLSLTPLPPPSSDDDEWDGILLGKVCFKEGARRTNRDGEEMVCTRNGRNQLRWRRAD
jgi:endonuclease YncB( thermonuclease family)